MRKFDIELPTYLNFEPSFKNLFFALSISKKIYFVNKLNSVKIK